MRTLLTFSIVGCLLHASATATERKFNARSLFDQSISNGVRLNTAGDAIELQTGEVIEDDGPAAGYSYKPNEEKLIERVWIKKELLIDKPETRSATLLVGPGGGLKALINGKPVELKTPEKTGQYWQAYTIPTSCLKEGTNEIVLSGNGKVWIARAEDFAAGSIERPKHPGRSSKSVDGGKTWAADRLGPGGDIQGEYCVRLFLDRHRATGSLMLPVVDVGNLSSKAIAPTLSKLVPVQVFLEAPLESIPAIKLHMRSANAPDIDSTLWSEWREIKSGDAIKDLTGRYIQVRADLTAMTRLTSPRLRGIRIVTDSPEPDDWSSKLKIMEAVNPRIVRSSIPFKCEPFDHPRLKELREKHKLDDLVKDAKSELDLIERLAKWSAGCWDKGHLKDIYPVWDALEILTSHADGKPIGGFCQQYNLVFLQACEAFGIPGRAISIGPGDHGLNIRGGHEVVELWSNQFQKWIYLDGNMAWYATDAESKVPLNLRELRQRQLDAFNKRNSPAIKVVELRETDKHWTGLDVWPPFGELRMIPRSNFLQAKAPLPLNQGMRGWFWSGHYVWTDEAYPASLIYDQRVEDAKNWDWTLNQASVHLEATATPGDVRVHFEAVTPGLDAFVGAIDKQPTTTMRTGYVWKLHSGKNVLEARVRNVAVREGPSSRIVLEYP